MITTVIVLLLLILAFGLIVLKQDAKQRRISRQVLAALGTPEETISPTTIRRQRSDHQLLRLLNYESNAPYWSMKYTVLIASIMAGATIVVSHLAISWWLGIPLGIVVGVLVIRGLLGWQRHRYTDRLLRQLPDCIEMAIGAVKAGLPVAEAFQTVSREMPAPTKDQFALVIQDIAVGRAPDEAVRSVYDRTGVTEYAILAVTLAVQARSGGRLAETLQILADTIRERVALAGRAKALAGEAKLSARVLACLPFAAGMVMYLERPASMDPLLFDPRGRFLFAIGITLLIMGILTMRQMIKKGTTV